MADKADLHIHTLCSDGRLNPQEAVKMAHDKKLKAIAITDHDTFKAYYEAKATAEELGIELIPGVEITTMYKNRECHLLAYYFDPDSGFFSNFVLTQRFARKTRIKGIIKKLNDLGLNVDYDEVWAIANGANIGRPHLARVLIEKGYVANHQEAFMRYLSEHQLGGIESSYPLLEEAIQMVKDVGGAAILAHPSFMYTEIELDEIVGFGIDGLECIHPSHNYSKQKYYSAYCEKHSLLETGGSDYHGPYDLDNTQMGIVAVAMKQVQQMKRMTEQRKLIIDLKD